MARIPAKYAPERRTRWECPDANGAEILAMPNIPKPCQGPGMQPRTLIGNTAWNRLRKRTYFLAGYKCEACGANCSEPGSCHCHELFSIDYKSGTSKFVRCVCLCVRCHVLFIHSGRALTLHKNKNVLYPAAKLLEGAEHGFRTIHEWNRAHPEGPKLKPYGTFLEYFGQEDLRDAMGELIDKYEIEFWTEDKKEYAPWQSWKVVVGSKEYPTPYKDYTAWEEAMKVASKNDTVRQTENPFTGGAYDEIAKLVDSQ